MRVLIQRVQRASCTVDSRITGEIGPGFCLFVGIGPEDTEQTARKMKDKILKLRIFDDGSGHMNLNIQQTGGSVLSVSQFTLYADCRKGTRPGFSHAASPAAANQLWLYFNRLLEQTVPVETGIFGADMKVELINDGPVTIWLDSEEWEK